MYKIMEILLFLTLICTIFCLSAFPVYSANQTALQKTFYNIFEKGIYDAYLASLQVFLKKELTTSPLVQEAIEVNQKKGITSFEQEGLQFISTLLHPPIFADSQAKSLFHQKWISSLRQLIHDKEALTTSSSSLAKEINSLINHLTIWMYTESDIWASVEKVLYHDTCLSKEQVDALYLANPVNFFNLIHEKFSKSTANQPQEESNSNLNDPVLYGDVPSYLFTLNNRKKTRVIRTPNVARDLIVNEKTGKPTAVQLNEEFKNYLLARKDKIHLYVNFMPRDVKTLEIEKLDEDAQLGNSILVITLAKSKKNDFYCQRGIYEASASAQEFKALFLQQFFKKEGEYYWSKKIDLFSWKQEVAKIIEATHSSFFQNKPHLDQLERQDFIDLSYIMLLNHLVDSIEPDMMNMTCKGSVDRGPSFYVLFYLHHQLIHGKMTANIYQRLYVDLFAPPIILNNRQAHGFRIERVQSTYNRLMDYYAESTARAVLSKRL